LDAPPSPRRRSGRRRPRPGRGGRRSGRRSAGGRGRATSGATSRRPGFAARRGRAEAGRRGDAALAAMVPAGKVTGRTVSLTATLWHCPPQRSPSAPCRFGSRCAVRCLVPYARSRRMSVAGSHLARFVPAVSAGSDVALSRGPGSAAELSQSMRPLALRARLAASLPLSIRKPMIVAERLRVVARMGAVRSPLWGMRREGLPGRITPKGHAPRERIAETVCVWQFRLPPRHVHRRGQTL
jgi:hypothetical protein